MVCRVSVVPHDRWFVHEAERVCFAWSDASHVVRAVAEETVVPIDRCHKVTPPELHRTANLELRLARLELFAVVVLVEGELMFVVQPVERPSTRTNVLRPDRHAEAFPVLADRFAQVVRSGVDVGEIRSR